MADEFYIFQVSTPPGTTEASPQVTNTAFPVRIVRRIIVKVPPGPSGHLRFQISVNGVAVIPVNGLEFITTDNDRLEFDVVNVPESGAWQVKSWNTGIFPHQIEVRYEVDLPVPKGVSAGRQLLAL